MKGDINLKRKILGFFLIGILAISTCIPVSANDSFEGWDEDTKGDVWAVYTTTDWASLQDKLILDLSISSSMKADVSITTRGLESIVREHLNNSNGGIYGTEAYTELFLAMIDVLSDGMPVNDDPCNIKKYIDPDAENLTTQTSIDKLIQRYFAAENAHSNFSSAANIYDNNAALMAVVQGTIMGSGYAGSVEEYTVENAQAYYETNQYPEKITKYAQFANLVGSKYSTTNMGNGCLGVAETQFLQDVAAQAATQETLGYGSFMCEAWVEAVYEVCGGPRPWQCCASSAADAFVQSTDKTNIPVGACVYGYSNPYVGCSCGRDAGHVGIYIGNGQVAHNAGGIRIDSLDTWIAGFGWAGWGYNANYTGA